MFEELIKRCEFLSEAGAAVRDVTPVDVARVAHLLTEIHRVDIDAEVEQLLVVPAGTAFTALLRLVVASYRSAEMAGGRTIVLRDNRPGETQLRDEAVRLGMWDKERLAALVPWGYRVTLDTSGWRIG